MKKNVKFKMTLLVLIPYLVGELINRLIGYGITRDSSFLLTTSSILLSFWWFGSVVFWFWVGRQFGKLRIERIRSFILGNLIWGISLFLFIWQFFLVKGANRSLSIAALSQHYVLGFAYWASKLMSLFKNTIMSTIVILLAYLIMIIVFTVGFISVQREKPTS